MQEPPKVLWPDKSQFATDFKDRRARNKARPLPLAVDERKERKFDNSIHTLDKHDARQGQAKAAFTDEELRQQCQAKAAKAAAAAAPEVLVQAAPQAIAVELTPEAIASVEAKFSGPPWD
ncbi:MAG: hypothetical protein V4488_09855 [Pseudomonadota bacterium]